MIRKKKRRKPVRRRKNRLIAFLLILFAVVFFLGGDDVRETQKKYPTTAENVENKIGHKFIENHDGFASHWQKFSNIKKIMTEHRSKDYVSLEKICPDVQQAVIAVEDGRFYSHHGFDWEGILRAAFVNVQSGEIEEGASTITQQLVKNLLLSPEQTFGRKAEEILLAVAAERNFSKDEILEMYLNTIYFGSNFYGIAAASEGYFGKSPAELNLAEAAMLAGLPNAPSLYSPYVDFMLAKKRQVIVLDAMEKRGYISKKAAENAKIQPLELVRKNG